MGRYLAGRAVTLSHTFLDDETLLSPSSVAVTVTRVGATTPAAQGDAVPNGDAFEFAAGLLPEGVYAVRWDGGIAVDTDQFEVVGGYLFSIPEARESDEALTADRYAAEEIRHYREVVEDEFERIAGRSFVPRTKHIPVGDVPGCGDFLPLLDVRTITVVGGTSDGVELEFERVGPFAVMPELPADEATGVVDATGIDVAYGFVRAPEDVRRVGMVRLRYLLAAERSGIPDRATTFQPAEGGTYTLATPGRGESRTGIPEVDAVLNDYRLPIIRSVTIT